jgi:hypothetical protein
MKRSQDEIVSLIYTGGMRNISAGAVLAVSFFPVFFILHHDRFKFKASQQIAEQSGKDLLKEHPDDGFSVQPA